VTTAVWFHVPRAIRFDAVDIEHGGFVVYATRSPYYYAQKFPSRFFDASRNFCDSVVECSAVSASALSLAVGAQWFELLSVR